MNSRLWNSGVESDKDIARSRKRQTRYVSNIMVISDPANPENEGKVFLYRYGPKIFNKIQEAMQPEFQDEEPLNPFDFWSGADFKLKIRKVGGYVNYDKSEFATPSELKTKLDTVIGSDPRNSAPEVQETVEDTTESAPTFDTDSTESSSKQSTLDYFNDLANED